MRPYRFELDLDEDLSNLAGSFALMASALTNELFPGPENHTKWCAAMRLLATAMETQVLSNEVGAPDDIIGFGDLDELDEKANRLRRILAR
jgi:hypothetical protein